MKPPSIFQDRVESFGFNTAHVATISSSLSTLAKQFNFGFEHEIDDLEEREIAYLKLEDGFRFYLCKYKSRPESIVELFFCSKLDDWEHWLEQVSAALGIASSELLWKNAAYMKTP